MTKNQKIGFGIARIGLAILAVSAVPSIYFVSHHRSHQFRLDDPNPAVRVAAIRATGWEGHVDMLTEALQDEDADVRLVAAMYLERRKDKAAPAIDALITALRDKHEGVRRKAAEALRAIGTPAAPALVKALEDSDPRVRAKAARVLSVVAFTRGQPPSRDVLAVVASALEKLLTDEDPEVRENAADTLKYVGRAAAGQPLSEK